MSAASTGWRRAARWVSAIALGGVLSAACATPAPAPGGDFTLTDHHGEPFHLASTRGKVVVIFFGYCMCPDVCPTTLSKLASVARRLGDQRDLVKTLYISVDPERDTPEVLKADLEYFPLDALGLTGTREEVDRVVAQFGAEYRIVPTPESAGRYAVTHTTTLYVLDQGGRVRLTFPYEATTDEIVTGIRSLLGPADAPEEGARR